METNLLKAIINIDTFHNTNLSNYSENYLIGINIVGAQLEFFLKDALEDAFNLPQDKKELQYTDYFSYLGSQNNPPDMIIKGSDAIEVKKSTSYSSSVPLNSSPPKNKLHVKDIRISNACRQCEEEPWVEKDIFYAMGIVPEEKGKKSQNILSKLFFIHGLCYCADHELYNKVHEEFNEAITEIADHNHYEMADSHELGRLKRIDPLGRTIFRMRGMWEIESPFRIFSDYTPNNSANIFELTALLTQKKYDQFPLADKKKLEQHKNIEIKKVQILDPNNPAKKIPSVVITLAW